MEPELTWRDPDKVASGAAEAACRAVLRALTLPAFLHRGGGLLCGNASLARLLGYAEDQLLAMAPDELVEPDMRGKMAAHGRGCLERDPEPAATEMTLRTANGDARFVELTSRRIDIAGQATVLSTCRDLGDIRHVQQLELLVGERTAQRDSAHRELSAFMENASVNYARLKETNTRLEEAQNQLMQSEKMASIGQLAAGVAHEINNPIGFVNSNLNSLKHYVDDLLLLIADYEAAEVDLGPEARRRLQASKEAVDLQYMLEDLPVLLRESADGLGRVKRIVQDLKDFSRVDNSDWADADLNAGLDSTLNVVLNEVKYKANVVKNYGSLPPVYCLAAQLNQVFMNFIVNAAHAIETRGEVTLSTGHCGAWVWVEVADTGSGMSEEVQRRIFEPFYTTKPVGKGTGLGLSLSFSIVQKHKGFIKVKSEPGKGSAFRAWIPVNPEDPDGAPPLPAGVQAN
jgi:PAS domain S-box-containing protein